MSLFKACDWWSTLCGSEETFDRGCLAIANIDGSTEKSDKIIVGSLSGVLRIYKPQPVKQDDGTYSNFRADELLLEAQLSHPIIGIGVGMLASPSDSHHLAVLHPYKVSIYSVSAQQGTVEHGTHYRLTLVYEHTMQRHAFTLSIGQFGGQQGKDMLCVMSLDGTLSFFEQERFSFSRFLPNVLLPGPLVYLPKTDSFVVISGFHVESYRFQALASASDESNENENVTFQGKRVSPEWKYILADNALDVDLIHDKTSPTIVILGERYLTALNSHGLVKFSKKFSFTPRCFTCYKEDQHGSTIVLIVTSNQTLLVYHETQLKWAAQLVFLPVCIHRALFMEVKGIVVLLSEEGNLACCYLGTEPSLFVSPVTEPKEVDFKEAEQEMHRLKKIIRSSNQNLLGTQKLGNEMSISIAVSQQLITNELADAYDDDNNGAARAIGLVPSVPVKIILKCRTVVHDVRLNVHVVPPLRVSQSVFSFGSVVDGSQAAASVTMAAPHHPSSLKITAQVAYTNSYGAPRVIDASSLLPFGLVAKICPPAKEAECKITVDVNKKTVSLNELFPDLCTDGSSFPGGAMGIEYYSGHTVSVLPSKTANRYRIQSEHFPALWLVTSEIYRRLNHKYRKEPDNERLQCSFTPPMPLHEYFGVIDDHFANRQAMQEMETLIAHRSLQFRVVQKRLLTKLKDSTPTPLNNLDTLLEATHRHIMSLTETMERHVSAFRSSGCALGAATHLVLLLLGLATALREDEIAFLTACFAPHVDFSAHQGWEEEVNASLLYLLKFCLCRENHENKFPDPCLEMPKDLSKLKKHVTLALDKILKYGSLKLDVDGGQPAKVPEPDEALSMPEGCRYLGHGTSPPLDANENYEAPAIRSATEEDEEEEMII